MDSLDSLDYGASRPSLKGDKIYRREHVMNAPQEDPVGAALYDIHQAHTLTDWVRLREGAEPGFRATNLFRQTKPVLARVCGHLDLPVDGTKAALLLRLRLFDFSEAQRDEIRAFKERQRAIRASAAVVQYRLWQLEKMSSGPRPFVREKQETVDAMQRMLEAELRRNNSTTAPPPRND